MKRGRPSWKKRIWLHAGIIGGALGVMFVWIFYAWAVPLGDFDTVHPVPQLAGIVVPIAPELQVEKHTCGLHAISSIYRSYGLDPKERRLRQRLGVDNRSIVYDSTTTGCLHPDIYRVVTQDGFAYQSLDLAASDSKATINTHLAAKDYALALIKRRENGNMHWVVICGQTNDQYQICDSMRPEIYYEPVNDFWDRCLLSVVLMKPAPTSQQPSIWRLHARGVSDMYQVFRRK